MARKRFKHNVSEKFLRMDRNVNFINPSTFKVRFKMLTKHMRDKEEKANHEL